MGPYCRRTSAELSTRKTSCERGQDETVIFKPDKSADCKNQTKSFRTWVLSVVLLLYKKTSKLFHWQKRLGLKINNYFTNILLENETPLENAIFSNVGNAFFSFSIQEQVESFSPYGKSVGCTVWSINFYLFTSIHESKNTQKKIFDFFGSLIFEKHVVL